MGAQKVCRHCSKKPVNRPRGLCWACWHDPAVRFLYPVGSANPATARYVPHRRGGQGVVDDEPTMEELEALIAERLPTMPKAPPGEVGYRLPAPQPRRR